MSRKKIVIIGGGFGGVFSAKYLRKYGRGAFDIELISTRNYFVFQPLLPEIASGTLNAQDAVTPLRLLLRGVQLRLAEVQEIDFENKTVTVLQGSKTVVVRVAYDHLIIATGQETDLTMFQGFGEHSMTMKDLADAHRLRNHVIRCLELADVTQNAARKRAALTFVVAGGGFSGVETIGEMVEMIRRTLHFYPNIDKSEIRPILLQRGPAILPEMGDRLGRYALGALRKAGIDVRLETGVQSATGSAIATDDGQIIETMTSVTTIGSGPSPFLKSLNVPLTRGKIVVDRTLGVAGHENVWALGDAAHIPLDDGTDEPPQTAPPTAQFAVREARVLARNIVAASQGKALRDFSYRPLGMLASLGNYKGVANVLGVPLTGLIAWILWRGLYIGMLPGLSTRLRVALNWLFDYFMPRTIVHLAERDVVATAYVHYAKGDVVFEQGQVIKGVYAVVSGRFEMVIENADGAATIKRFARGDHWGERILQKDILTTGKVTAVEDSVAMVLQCEDFKRLYDNFKPLREYFDSVDEQHYSPRARN